jgi:NADH-quinone oxidoreductase subunit G
VVDICPVGALVSRDFLHKARVWHLDNTPSVCGHCATGCNIEVHTQDEVVQRLKPRYNPDVNGYWMCDQGRLGYGHVHDEARLVAARRNLSPGADDGVSERLGFQAAIAEACAAVERGADKAYAIASAWMTNEELFALTRVVPRERIALMARAEGQEQRFYPSWGDSERNPSLPQQHDRGRLHDDGATFVIHADRNPNRAGARRILGEEACSAERLDAVLSAALADQVETLVVFSGIPDFVPPEVMLGALSHVPNVLVVDVADGPLTRAASLVIPGAATVEKRGTFTNAAGRTQRLDMARPTPGQARTELEVLHALGAALGRDMGACSPRRLFDALVGEVDGFGDITWADTHFDSPPWTPHMAAAAKRLPMAPVLAPSGRLGGNGEGAR